MAKKPRRYLIAKLLLALVVLLALAAMLLPWKPLVETRLVRMLEAQGFEEVKLSVGQFGLKGITLTDVSLGRDTPLRLNNVTVGYALADLRAGSVRDVTLSGVDLTLEKREDGWMIAGFAPRPQDAEEPLPFTLPVTRAELAILPVPIITVENSSLAISSDGLQGKVPLTLAWSTAEAPKLAYEATGSEFTQGALAVTTGKTTLDAALNEEERTWHGNWTIADIALTGLPVTLPSLHGKGTLTATAERATVEGTLSSADGSYHLAFRLPYRFDAPDAAALTITSARLPWNGGVISVSEATVPFNDRTPIRFTLTAQKVSMEMLMDSLTGDKAKGSGSISGSVPVTIQPDGAFRFGDGDLKADAPGTIALAPEVIPGDNPQVALVRDILKNLHYSLLSLRLENKDKDRLTVYLTVEGTNPDVSGSRPVRLNVQLNGDLLQLVTHSIMPLADPKTLLQQETK